LQQLTPESGAYNLVYAVELHGKLDLSAFKRAFSELAARHDALRTTFLERDGNPVRLIHPHMDGYFEIEDAQDWTEAALKERLNTEVYRSFDMTRGPLARMLLLKRSTETWVLLLSMHHSITDLWSFAIFIYELSKLYDQEATGTPAKLRDLRANYTDFVRQQEDMVSGPEGEAVWQYWRDQLAGELSPLELPIDHPRPPQQSYRGAAQSLVLDASLTQALKALSEAQGIPLHVTLLAAYQTLLHRYTGQPDIRVGSPKAGRTARFGRLIGYFVNTVVLRARFSEDPTFLNLLTQVHENVTGAFTHDKYPFSLLVERLQPTRDVSRAPIFQVMFAWQKTTRMISSQSLASFALNRTGRSLKLGNMSMELLPLEQRVVPFELSLWMTELGDELGAMLEYSTALFEPETMTQLLHHFETLLRGIVADPDRPISALPLITDEERQKLLFDWNEPQKEKALQRAKPAANRWIPDSVAVQAAQRPESLALACGDERLTYQELDRRANRLAHYLQRLGVKPNSRVGVCMERSSEAIVSILGILKAGATYLPLDPIHPQERMAFILEDAQVDVVLTQERFTERLTPFDAQLITLDDPAIAQHPDDVLSCPATSEDAAYVIYTSGSTGQPKGVLVPYGTITNHCHDMIDYYELTPQDRVLQFASLNFDASLEQILPTLMVGAGLIMRDETIWTPAEFYRKARQESLTVINVPPAYWQQLASGWTEDLGERGLRQIRLVIIGGDVMQPETLRLWRRTPLRDARLLNAYGPTETTITATTFEVPPDFDPDHRIPIGRPLPNRRAYILDSHQQPVPVGVPGELYLGGAGVATGYLNRPELTKARFVPDPFVEGDRLYRTGDRVRYRRDGALEFLGRVDDQVKIRGFRIELGEIESALHRHPKVQETAVIVREDTPNNPQLVGYVVPEDGNSLEPRELTRFLKARVPGYMVPAAFVVLDALPMSSGIKVDRQALPPPAQTRTAAGAAYVAPSTPVEEKLTEIWSQVLGVPQVGVLDDFFELGGHSLLATQIASRVRDIYHVELPLRTLFDAPTVAELAVVVAQSLAEQESDDEIEALLAELDNLSDDEAQALLGSGAFDSL
jgi:amino acid adenylation domain-containing protein